MVQISQGGLVFGVSTDTLATNSLTANGLNTIRTLINRAGVWSAGNIDGWGDAYIDSNGRENSVDVSETRAIFDTNKYISNSYFVVIEATSLTESNFQTNGCDILQLDTGKWLLYYETGTLEVQRAQVLKTLFYGTDGTNDTVTGITGLTALRSSDSRDVGKRAHYATLYTSGTENPGIRTYTGTFADTSTNTDCSSWSYCNNTVNGVPMYANWEKPSGSTLNTAGNNTTSDETGTDTSADEVTNPANCQLALNDTDNDAGENCLIKSIILCSGDITWVLNNAVAVSASNVDFFTDSSIPDFTASSSSDEVSIITHTIPAGTFSSTIDKSIGVPFIEDWETDADIQYKFTNATEDSGWLSCSNTPVKRLFTAFTSEPTSLIVKLIPKTASPTAGYPSIKGFWVKELK